MWLACFLVSCLHYGINVSLEVFVVVFLSLSCSMGQPAAPVCLAPACFSRKPKQPSAGSVIMLMGATEQMLLLFQELIFL